MCVCGGVLVFYVCVCVCVCIYEQSKERREKERGWGGVVIGSAFTFVSFVSRFVLFTLCLKVCWSSLPTDMSLQRLFSLATVAPTLIQLNWISIEMKNCRQVISWTPTFAFYLARIHKTLFREHFEQNNHIHNYRLMLWKADRCTVIDQFIYSENTHQLAYQKLRPEGVHIMSQIVYSKIWNIIHVFFCRVILKLFVRLKLDFVSMCFKKKIKNH